MLRFTGLISRLAGLTNPSLTNRSPLNRSPLNRCLLVTAVMAVVVGTPALSYAAGTGPAQHGSGQPGAASVPGTASGSGTTIYVSPSGSDTYSGMSPEQAVQTLQRAQQIVRSLDRDMHANITVELAAGTYRLSQPLAFDARDSGTNGYLVTWTAVPGAHPVLSGAERVTGWRQSDPASNVWVAKVPAGTVATQVYVDGQAAPVDQQSPQSLHLDLSSSSVTSGFQISGSTASYFAGLVAHMSAAQLREVRFVWNPAVPTDWEESECPVDSVTAPAVLMAQPCWNNLTNKEATRYGGNSSNVTPYNLNLNTAPSAIENTYVPSTGANPPAPGQWYLDQPAGELYYVPPAGQDMPALNVEVPRTESLLAVAGTLGRPVTGLTFRDLTFEGTTWNQPATDVGFAQVQANLDVTQPDVTVGGVVQPATQGECAFATPVAGSCPWGAFGEPAASVVLSAARGVTFTGDTFDDLGGIGLKIEYGSDDDLVQGDTFTQIAGSAVWLGCSGDPNPGAADDPAATVIADCSSNPAASAADNIGAGGVNEIMTGNTIDNNLIYHDGYGYIGAAGVTLMFTRHTTVSHNEIFDLPYDGVTSGAWEGHADVPRGGEPVTTYYNTTTNIDADNAITDNVFHQVMQTYGDGGAIYSEGHQGPTRYNANGSVNYQASFGTGMTIRGNVGDNDSSNYQYFYAPDVGSQWITVTGNVEWNAPNLGNAYSMSSHWPDSPSAVYTWTSGNWFANPDDTPNSPGLGVNTVIPDTPGPADLPLDVISDAGLAGSYRALEAAVAPSVYYTGISGTTELIAGEGLTDNTVVRIGGVRVRLRFLSAGFALATIPPGADGTTVTVSS